MLRVALAVTQMKRRANRTKMVKVRELDASNSEDAVHTYP